MVLFMCAFIEELIAMLTRVELCRQVCEWYHLELSIMSAL
jgi:hypothetical protein